MAHQCSQAPIYITQQRGLNHNTNSAQAKMPLSVALQSAYFSM